MSEIVRGLPGTLGWMVLFDLSKLRRMIADPTVREMFFLPESTDLELYSHVVLTSGGQLLASRNGSGLVRPGGGNIPPESVDTCLYSRFSDRFDLFPMDEADCLAIGEAPPFPPVLLYLQIEAGHGEAKAVFAEEPTGEHYELLKASGVEYLGGEQEGAYYVARFRNHLPTHVHAGELARFSRTGHCNLFFLRHGSIDRQLELGLIKASSSRVAWGAAQTQKAVSRLADEADDGGRALTCHPPPPAKAFAYGDIVPLGFLLRAADRNGYASSNGWATAGATSKLRALLERKRQGPLWSYHTGGLVTSTDSVLVLQGLPDPDGIRALETFADGEGGYLPQLSSEEGGPGRMVAEPGNRHWRQPDFATTCLVRALRREAGLGERTGVGYLEERFQSRSGLYFANPYLVDWVLALAIAGDPSAGELRDRLAGEVLASINDDYSFGGFDVPLSSSFAILALSALGYEGRALRVAQLRLLDFIEPDGALRGGTPFYSTVALEKDRAPAGVAARAMLEGRWGQVVWANRELHAVSVYRDDPGMIPTSVAASALLAPTVPESPDPAADQARAQNRHPRYGCRDQLEYIQKFALPPYLEGR
ncbi:MAG: hypothetical protein ACFB50_03900 [Rubrobacteraceae bacterium]